jgi:hypothetical protein
VSLFDTLPEHQQLNVLRVLCHAEARAASLNQPFELDLESAAEAMEDFGGLNDPTFVLPAGLVGKW